MKALSIHQPYATQIAFGIKHNEYRNWKTNYRGDLLICSTARPQIGNYLCGNALCVVTLYDCIEIIKPSSIDYKYRWLLLNPQEIEPFPIKGQQGLFEVDNKIIEYL